MQDFVIGLLAIVVGGLICFFGYLAMRVIIPIWGAFAGFMLGAGFIANITDDGFLRSVLAWVVGLAVAMVFAGLAYLFYEVSILIAMAAIGFALGTSVMVALGVTWSWLVVLVGVVVGALLALVAVIGDMPTVVLVVLTALAGASTVVFGLMLWFGAAESGEFDSASATKLVEDDWWWYAIYLVLAIIGMLNQLRFTTRLRLSVREQWSASGGRQFRAG